MFIYILQERMSQLLFLTNPGFFFMLLRKYIPADASIADATMLHVVVRPIKCI
jgi:hypothetical protein